MRALGRVALVPAAALTALLVFIPVLAVVVLGVPGLGPTLADPTIVSAARRGVQAATLAASAAWCAGVLAAFGVWGGGGALRRLVLTAAWFLLLVPAQGWRFLVQGDGFAPQAAACIARAAPASGLVVLIMTAALNRLDPQILRSAAASGAPPLQAWLRAVLPALAWPLGLAGAGAFALCLWQPLDALHAHPALGGLLGQAVRQHDTAAAPEALLMAAAALAPLLPLGLLALLIRRLV